MDVVPKVHLSIEGVGAGEKTFPFADRHVMPITDARDLSNSMENTAN